MNRRCRHKILFLIPFISILILGSHAQSRYDSSFSEVAKRNMEELLVFTDRTLYAVNESIQFSAFLQSKEEAWGLGSKVLYAELVNSTGTAVVKGKYLITENRSNGFLSLPSSLMTGIYFLRCYTRWMRNFGPLNFTYIPIRVVSPYSTDILENNPLQGLAYLSPVPEGVRAISASTTRHSYLVGEMVDVELSLNEGSVPYVQHACITVVPSGAIDTSVFLHRVDSKMTGTVPFQFDFLPERKGMTISGIALDKSKQEPAPDTRIHFSILGEKPDYFVSRSDQEGRFLINTHSRTGYQEMFVAPESSPGKLIEVRIDNDFTSEPLPFDPDSFDLHHDEQLLASRLSLHMQLQRAFLTDTLVDKVILSEGAEPVPFYGTPEISVKIDEFISLPNMEELIDNLIPKTFVKRSGSGLHFMIENENPMISMFPPLILIDHIPVLDMEVILSIHPSKIERIDVIPEVYVMGEIKYGGIISFISNQGDMASIKLPEGSYFFDYVSYQASLIPNSVRFPESGNFPDTRNTLYWEDHMELQRDAQRKVSFQGPAVPGTYTVMVRGLSSDGNIVYGLNHFSVE